MEKRRHDFSGHYNLLHPPIHSTTQAARIIAGLWSEPPCSINDPRQSERGGGVPGGPWTSFDPLSILPSIPACHPGILSTNQTPRSNYLSQLRGPDCLPASLTKAFSSGKRSAFWAMSRYLPALLVSPLADSKRP